MAMTETMAEMTLMNTSELPPLVLASGSPRRKELLASLGLDFQVIPSTVDESAIDISGCAPAEIVARLAREKAADVAANYPEHLVIGSDTIVVLGDEVFGKPKDKADAFRMLKALQGRTHQVHTGIAVFYRGEVVID